MTPTAIEAKRRYELARYHEKRTDMRERVRLLIETAKKRSKRTGRRVQLSKAWRNRAARQSRCAVTGILFDLSSPRSPLAPSLDRINPTKPYTDKNTRLVLYFVNVAKSDWTDEQFRTLVMVAASNLRH